MSSRVRPFVSGMKKLEDGNSGQSRRRGDRHKGGSQDEDDTGKVEACEEQEPKNKGKASVTKSPRVGSLEEFFVHSPSAARKSQRRVPSIRKSL